MAAERSRGVSCADDIARPMRCNCTYKIQRLRDRLQSPVQVCGRDMTAVSADQVSPPALAILAHSTLPHLRQEGAQSNLIEFPGLWQTIGVLVGSQSRFGLRAELTINTARVKP